MGRETEVKIRISDPAVIRRALRAIGFRRSHPRAFEDNVLYDTPGRELRRVRSLVRLRRYGRRWWMTYKGTPDSVSRYKSRVELETSIDNPQVVSEIFKVLGLLPVFRYQKYRSKWTREPVPGRRTPKIEVALDETPIGWFIEVEGSRAQIAKVARELGFSKADYSTESYGSLYLKDSKEKGIVPFDMVFDLTRDSSRRKQPSG